MRIIKIAFFDGYTDTGNLHELKISFKVLEKKLIVSKQIRLRRRKNMLYTFNILDYGEYQYDWCFGVEYTLEINDSDREFLDGYMSNKGFASTVINAHVIETNLKDFLKNKFKMIEQITTLCYTIERTSFMDKILYKRDYRVNFAKSFLINLI